MSASFQSVAEAAPFSWLAVVGMGVALASCLLAFLLRTRIVASRRGRAFPALFCSLALLIATGAAVVGVEVGRREVAEQLLGPDAAAVASDTVARGIVRQLACLALLGPIALVSLLSAALFRWIQRRESAARPSRATVALGTTLVLPVVVGALGASIYGLWVHAGYVANAYVDPSGKELALLERLQQAYHLLRLLRASIVVSAAAGLVSTILWVRSGAAQPPSRGRVAMAGALFAAGLGAFVLTRAHAADGTPLSILTGNQRSSFGVVYTQKMPHFSRCQPPAARAPVLEFSPQDVLFDRGSVSPGELKDRLATQRDLFPVLHPGEPLPPPALMVVADVATPIDRVMPYLERAGEIEIFMVGANPRSFESRTLGIIDRREFCFRAFFLREDGVSLSTYRTWGDLALAVERSAAVLKTVAR